MGTHLSWKMAWTLAYEYLSQNSQWELSNEHGRVYMVFRNLWVIVLWMKVEPQHSESEQCDEIWAFRGASYTVGGGFKAVIPNRPNFHINWTLKVHSLVKYGIIMVMCNGDLFMTHFTHVHCLVGFVCTLQCRHLIPALNERDSRT